LDFVLTGARLIHASEQKTFFVDGKAFGIGINTAYAWTTSQEPPMKLDFSPFLSRLYEKGGKRHDVPAHHKAEEYMDQYFDAAGIAGFNLRR
jgi:hypothetical protein